MKSGVSAPLEKNIQGCSLPHTLPQSQTLLLSLGLLSPRKLTAPWVWVELPPAPLPPKGVQREAVGCVHSVWLLKGAG